MDFMQYWQISDMITKTLFFLLLILSIISWVTGIIRVMQSRKLAATVADDLSQQIKLESSKLDNQEPSMRRLVIEQALLKHIGRYRFASERGLPILGTTAAIAPFIGLFGTVWGIMTSFQDIGVRGSASLAVVAPGISEALVATAAGLAVAIPAVLAYNWLQRRNKLIAERMSRFCDDLHGDLMSGGKIRPQVKATAAAAKPAAATAKA